MSSAEQQAVDQAYRDAWDAFVASGRIQPAFGTPSGAGMLHLVFLCPVGASPGVAAAVAPLQQRLAFPYADLVPAERRHVSVQGFDVEQSTWSASGGAVLAAARTVFAQLPSFTLRLGWPNSFPMAAYLRAEDGGMIRRMRAGLRAALPAWAGLDRDPLVHGGQDTWLPHLSLAYYNAEHDNSALVRALAPMRDEVIVDAPVREIHLVSTPADLAGAGRWVWPVHEVFALEHGAQA